MLFERAAEQYHRLGDVAGEAESLFWIGTFHQVSKKHLPLYLAEFDHRFNHRKITDGERTVAALRLAEGKRLTLKPLKGGIAP